MFRLINAICFLFISSNAFCEAYWSQGSENSQDGATQIYADLSARILWRQKLGDWIDRDGQLFGNQPFSVTEIKDLDTARRVSLDLTALIKYWINNPGSYHGVYLREISGKGTVHFKSSEADYLEAPFLAIQTSSNEIKTFEVEKDTYLGTSTVRSLGHLSRIEVGPQLSALLAFNKKFLELSSSEIIKASLYLSTTDRQYGHTQIGVFAIAPMNAPGDVETGIAWNYSFDQDLADHPDVILAEQFNTGERGFFKLSNNNDWQNHLSDIHKSETYRLVDAAYRHDRFAPLNGGALQITFNQETRYGFTGHYRFKNLIGQEPEQMYFRYYLRFGESWQPIDGGKLPGFAGTYGKAGWGGRAVDGYNGWSARGNYFLTASPNSEFSGSIPIGNYIYHLDSNSNYGELISWSNELNLLQRNRWYAIEQYLKLNDPGKANGQLTVWIDGRKIFSRSNFRFRETPQLKIESLWLNFYHGGTAKPKSTFHLYIDNLVIASRYIGPMKKK